MLIQNGLHRFFCILTARPALVEQREPNAFAIRTLDPEHGLAPCTRDRFGRS